MNRRIEVELNAIAKNASCALTFITPEQQSDVTARLQSELRQAFTFGKLKLLVDDYMQVKINDLEELNCELREQINDLRSDNINLEERINEYSDYDDIVEERDKYRDHLEDVCYVDLDRI